METSERSLIWAEIDLDAIGQNIRALKRAASAASRFMAVVKANAYGHGDVPVARRALAEGADFLGIARFAEAVPLRSAGIQAPILVFGHTPPELTETALCLDLRITLFDLDTAKAVSERARALGKTVKVHLKVDTGMGRLGILPDSRRFSGMIPPSAMDEIQAMAQLPGICLEGIYTHFASADSADKRSAEEQLRIFKEFLTDLQNAGITFSIRHAANSAGILSLPESHLDMVRAGISLYGLPPSEELDLSGVSLRPAMALKARIVHLKPVTKGFAVSYGSTWRAPAPTRIATVPVGYADGYSRLLSNRGHMLVRGRRAPIAGRVCMDQTMLDVGAIAGAAVGDEVVVFGTQQGAVLSADELARTLNTINYEIVSSIMARVPRVYLE